MLLTEKRFDDRTFDGNMSNYEKLFEHSADAMCELDAAGSIIRSNQAADRLLGTAPAATLFDLLDEASHDQLKRILTRLNETTPTDSFDGHRNDTESCVSWQLTWIGDNQIVAVGRDASVLHATSTALAQKSAFLESIIEAEPECVKIVNGDGLLLDMNKAGLRMIAAKRRADAVGQSTYDLIAPEDRERFITFNEQVCSGTGGQLNFDIIDFEGARHSMETTAVPLPKPPGGELLHLAITRDVTERHALERQLLQAQKMEAIGQLAGGVAHDFNNLLTAILGSAELALMDVPDGSPAAKDLRQIHDAGERAARLTKQLLAFAPRHVVQLEVLSLTDLVTSLREMLVRLLGEAFTLRLDTSTAVRSVHADRGHLEQVVLNLTINARDAVAPHGTISIEVCEETVSQERGKTIGCESGDYVVLKVSDNGPGIDKEHLPHIFDPFFTTKPAGSGTGLGLSTCYGIVEQLHGAITVTSAAGQGTTFCVFLPAHHEPVLAIHSPVIATKGNGEPILLVEDESIVRDAVSRMLIAAGFVVHSCTNAAEALVKHAELEHIALLVTDMTMPGMSGRDLATKLRAMRSNLPVLFITGYLPGTSDLDENATPDPTEVLQKPFSSETLVQAVMRALQPTHVLG
ncbi:MAG: two-component system cell cycle sensor histidine kinase/response regulator CckA [Planctomycetota bacterium]|jgi:two-component system cell cycle sensor histidine kinase/response regulator CckA